MIKKFSFSFAVFILFLLAGCSSDEPTDGVDRPVDENGKATFQATGDDEIRPGKDDSITGQRGLPVTVDGARTAVWEVENAWEDTNTASAREAGMAWPADSGMNWDEKYRAWVASLEKVETAGTSYTRDTFMLVTPWGKSIPAPALECAEVAIFLRIAFASWYNLPFFLEARDADGRIYFGHFGMRRADGRYGRMPNFRDRYPDFSHQADEFLAGGEWPSDPELHGRKIPGSFDDQQPMLGDDKHAGAYFDEVFLNKRVGHFLTLTLAWFGSVNLADSANTFNVVPQHVKSGDVLVERWQSVGIGHTLVVVRAETAGERETEGDVIQQYEVEVASGSMPRRQPVWESAGASKRYFSLNATGGEGKEAFGGGLKRWRTAKNINGRWTNVVMANYGDQWIDNTDYEAISQRLDTFRDILVELSPEQKRDVLLDIIESKRQHLQQYPASCAARIAREDAFDSLYELSADEFGVSESEVDAEYRRLADYVFAELEYDQSKTCCWNRSTNAMYEIVMDYNLQLQQSADMCVAPVVFMNRDDQGDGYEIFREHATALGREDVWNPWSEDESCPQRDVAVDTIAESDVVAYCEIQPEEPTEPTDPVDPPSSEVIVVDFGAGAIPDANDDGLTLTALVEAEGSIAGATLDVDISHTWRGDLTIHLVHPDGSQVELLERNGSDSSDDVVERFQVPDFFEKSSAGEYKVVIVDHASLDEGEVNSMKLELTVNN